MRKIVILALAFAFMGATAVYAAADKIAVCDLQQIADKSVALKDAYVAIEKALAPEKEKMEKERAALEKGVSIMDDAKASKKDREAFIARQQKYMQATANILANVRESEMKVRKEMDTLILAAAEEFGKREGYDMVLDTNAVLFQDKAKVNVEDVTDKMLKEVDRLWLDAKSKNKQQ